MKRILVALLALSIAGTALAVAPSTDQYLVSVARVQGQCPGGICALFRTDTWIFNPSTTQTATVTVDFLKRDQANPAPFATKTFIVAAKATLELADIFNNPAAFNIDPATGGFHVTSNLPVVVTGRIYDVNVVTNKGTGTAGQYYPGLDTRLAIGNGQFVDVIGTAEETDVWRTNLSIIETSGSDVTLKVERLDPANGTVLGTISSYLVRAREAKQINNVLVQPGMGASPLANQRIRVTGISGTGRVLVTASRLDSRTGDPYTIEMTTPAATGHTTGTFEGVINTSDGQRADGGVRLAIGSSGVTAVAGIAGLPCGFTVDFDATSNPPIALGSDGTFAVTIPNVPYVDGTTTVFTITWTISGALDSTGVISGSTVRTVTSGGAGTFASCNGTVDRTWRAGWVAD
ncbi:MAG: hypothetical protein HY825_14270 [Acidobacteria bacterium]|nr:hypothetical protein [Acidobacteriota bacterium]